jgi:hypothetical protein
MKSVRFPIGSGRFCLWLRFFLIALARLVRGKAREIAGKTNFKRYGRRDGHPVERMGPLRFPKKSILKGANQ